MIEFRTIVYVPLIVALVDTLIRTQTSKTPPYEESEYFPIYEQYADKSQFKVFKYNFESILPFDTHKEWHFILNLIQTYGNAYRAMRTLNTNLLKSYGREINLKQFIDEEFGAVVYLDVPLLYAAHDWVDRKYRRLLRKPDESTHYEPYKNLGIPLNIPMWEWPFEDDHRAILDDDKLLEYLEIKVVAASKLKV